MITHYFRLAIRLLSRSPFFTLINLFGLSTGFCVFFILWQYTQSELKSDQFRQDSDQIYRVSWDAQWTDDRVNWQQSTFSMGPLGFRPLINRYAHVLDQTMFMTQGVFSEDFTTGHGKSIFMTYEDDHGDRHSFVESKVVYAEPNFLEFFSIPMIAGVQHSALSVAGAVVISEKEALKYFSSTNVVGKTLVINNKIPLQVSGVFEDLPANTHLDFDIIISTERMGLGKEKFYVPGSHQVPYSYYKFPTGTNYKVVQEKINRQAAKEVNLVIWGNWPYGKAQLRIQPLKDLAFSDFRFEPRIAKSKFTLYLLSAAAMIILAMAWINYINLTIYASNKRMKELSARKTVGAQSKDLIFQFMVEASLINIFSFLLAATAFQILRSPANVLLHFNIPDWTHIPIPTLIILIAMLIGGIVVTSVYPAIVTMNRSPKIIVGTIMTKSVGNSVGAILSTIQFSGAVIIMICVYCVDLQMNFILAKNIGINKDHVVIVDLPMTPVADIYSDIDKLRNKLSGLKGISGCTSSNSMIADDGEAGLVLNSGDPGLSVDTNGGVDEHFIPFYEIKLLAGRNFSGTSASDKNSIIISRGAMLRLGIKNAEDAIGLKVYSNGEHPVEVIGVFEDYHLRALINQDITYGGLPGLALTYKTFVRPDLAPRKLSIKLNSSNFEDEVAVVKTNFQSVFPGTVFNWYFLEDQINDQYQSDMITQNQISFFSALAICIACVGLLGMITNKVVEKVKEIGIRKVLGAQLYDIAKILLNSTLRQVIIAIVIGVPISYFLAHQYLQKFSYRIDLQWWHFALPLIVLVAIMLSTISVVLLKAAKANPIQSLRND
ncbi:MAG: ABC transporter permease [Chryseolinea sp.]